MYHNIARSSGHGYWASVAYTFAGSALWEIAGETTPPSKNDQIASGIAGSFLGEPLFLTSRLLLGRRDDGPGFWRALAAAIASPPAGVNRAMFGSVSTARPRGHRRVRHACADRGYGRCHTRLRSTHEMRMDTSSIGVSVDYGFPGNPGTRTRDRSRIFASKPWLRPTGWNTCRLADWSQGVATRLGMRPGRRWLYGSYDYFAPDGFRVSSTALSLGTTLQTGRSTV